MMNYVIHGHARSQGAVATWGGGTVKSGEGLALPACAMHALM